MDFTKDGDRLSPGSEEIRRMCEAAAGFMTEYYEGLRARRVMPEVSSAELRGLVVEPMPRGGMEFDALLGVVRDVIVQNSRHNGHPRFFGYVASPGTAVSAVGEMLTATLNANVTSWRSSPAAAEIERVVVQWLKEMLGYPEGALGLFVSGGSMANFSALAAARAAKGPADVSQAGMGASGRPMRVYVSEETHYSSRKAAGLLGIGEANVVVVRTDGRGRMDVEDLQRVVRLDEEAGALPLCVVGSAGTVSTGAFDPLAEIGEVARAHNLWFHVDGAYGGFAALAPSARGLFRGIEVADSVTLDPHKWAYMPTGVGCVLYRDGAWARKAFAHDADYTRVMGQGQDESFAFWDYGPELSRRFRALGLWLLLKHVGAEALGAAIERNMACARYVERLVGGSDDLEMLAPVGLSVFCFRYAPPGYSGDLDEMNERVLVELQRDGSSYLSNARVGGRFALRGCVLNYRTTDRDMEVMVEDVRRVGRGVAGEA